MSPPMLDPKHRIPEGHLADCACGVRGIEYSLDLQAHRQECDGVTTFREI